MVRVNFLVPQSIRYMLAKSQIHIACVIFLKKIRSGRGYVKNSLQREFLESILSNHKAFTQKSEHLNKASLKQKHVGKKNPIKFLKLQKLWLI
jgi:hypothetical protein